MTEEQLKRKQELERLVKESGVEEELQSIDWADEKGDPLVDWDDPNKPMPEKYWNYFLLKNKIFDDVQYKEQNKLILQKFKEDAEKIRKGAMGKKMIEQAKKEWGKEK
jgi:hypothetical protein